MRLHNPPDGENQLSWELWKPALDAEAWTDFYLPGLWATIRASVLAVVGAVVFGLVFGVGRLLPSLLLPVPFPARSWNSHEPSPFCCS